MTVDVGAALPNGKKELPWQGQELICGHEKQHGRGGDSLSRACGTDSGGVGHWLRGELGARRAGALGTR